MRVHATCGDVYIFHGRGAIRYMAECHTCARKPPYPGPREFATEMARDAWAKLHRTDWPQHEVSTRLEVTA